MAEHVRIPGVPSLIARGGTELVFTGRDASIWVDLSAWPPRIVERSEYVLDAARYAAGPWLAYVRHGDRWSLRRYGSLDATAPDAEEAEPVPVRDLAALVADADAITQRIELAHRMRLESVHVLGERGLVVPRHVGLGAHHHPFLERAGGWTEETSLPPFEKTELRDRCATACLRLGDGSDVLVWDGHVFRCDAGAFTRFCAHRLQLAWYRDHAPVAYGRDALLACDGRRLVALDPDGVAPQLPGVIATTVQAGPHATYVVGTSSVPLLWSPGEDWACELAPDVLGRRGDVVGVAPGGGLVVYDRRDYRLTHVPASDLAALPRRRASDAPLVAVAAPVAMLDDHGAASRPRIAGAGEQLVTCSDHELRFHVADRAVGIERWASPIVAVAHDGRHVAALDAQGTLRVLRGADAGGPLSVRVAGLPRSLAAGPDDTWLVVVAHGAWLVDLRALARRGAGPEPIALPGALAAAVDPAGTVLLVGERARIATWSAGVLTELPPTIEQIVACAPLGEGRFACAGERHLFAFDLRERELELLQRPLQRDEPDSAAYVAMRTPLLAASPDGRMLAWAATPTSIHIATVRGSALEIVDNVFYADEYSQPLDTPLVIRGLAFTSATTLAIALDHGRGNLIDLAARTACKLDPQLGDGASRWIFFYGGKSLIAE